MAILGQYENLDYAATTPVDEKILKAIIPYFSDRFANAGVHYGIATHIKQVVQTAREQIAESLRCQSSEVVFTSGGTESNNWVLRKFPYNGKSLAVSATEHDSVFKTAEALGNPIIVPVDEKGILVLDALEEALKQGVGLVSVHAVNHETGRIQPLERIYELCKAYGACLHTDASQAWGKEKGLLYADYITISGHKVYAPKGIGALIHKKTVPVLEPLLTGGGQQEGRSGTLPVPLIMAMGLASTGFQDNYTCMDTIKISRDKILAGLKGYRNVVLNSDQDCQAGFLNFSTACDASYVIALMESEYGIFMSRGSACMQGRISRTVQAMGKTKEAQNTIRISLSKYNKPSRLSGLEHKIEACISKASLMEI